VKENIVTVNIKHLGTKMLNYHEIGLTLILLTWSIGWAPNNARKWQMGFNWDFKVLIEIFHLNYLFTPWSRVFLEQLTVCS
jgi:hypothetical protein